MSAQELKVEGNLKVTGTIQNDSLMLVIATQNEKISALESIIAQLQTKIALIEAQILDLQIQTGITDCNGILGGGAEFDECGICEGNNSSCWPYDIDGNAYQPVTIGDQVWMAENLKVTHYRNGDEIPNITNNDSWPNLTTGAYGDYENNISNSEIYGRYYNWYAVDDGRGICPEEWHVPSDDEVKELEMYLGMSEAEANHEGWRGTDVGSKLASNEELWEDHNLEESPEFGTSGFAALPGGKRTYNYGYFGLMGIEANFWTATNYTEDDSRAWHRHIDRALTTILHSPKPKSSGVSVRCIQD